MKVALDLVKRTIQSSQFYHWEVFSGTVCIADYKRGEPNEVESIAELENVFASITSGVAVVKIFRPLKSAAAGGRPPTRHTKEFTVEVRPSFGGSAINQNGVATSREAQLLAKIEELKYSAQLEKLTRQIEGLKESKRDVWDHLAPAINGLVAKISNSVAPGPVRQLAGPTNADVMSIPMTDEGLQQLINIWAQYDADYFIILKQVVNLAVKDPGKYNLAKTMI